MISKSPLKYLARKGLWNLQLEPIPRYQLNQLHSHGRPVVRVDPQLLPEDSPGNKVTTEPRLGEQ